MKKIFFLVFMIFMAVPISDVFAHEGGLLEGKPMTRGTFDTNIFDTKTEFTDNDLETYSNLGMEHWNERNIWYSFDKPVSIDSMFIKYQPSSVTDLGINIQFLDEDKNELLRITTLTLSRINEQIYKLDNVLHNVSHVNIFNTSGSRGFNIYEFDVYSPKPFNYDKVLNVSVSHDYNSVNFSWENPNNEHFIGVVIKQNNKEIVELDKYTTKYTVKELAANTIYRFDVLAKYADGGLAEPVSISVTTDKEPENPILEDVANVKVKTEHNRVDLSWHLPESPTFKHVNIYRDEIKEKQSALNEFFLGKRAYAASSKIFETNGTYFNDFTVKPETKYEYTLKTTDGEIESEGITVQAETLPTPPPAMGGVDGEKLENGDYRFTWQEPAEGEVKIIVGGKEYSTVPAGDKSFTIPSSDMKYTPLGDPDVSLQPISVDGKPGEAIESPRENLKVPFTVTDLLEAGSALLWLVGPFLLLALAFLLVPKFRKLVINSFRGKKAKELTERRLNDEKIEQRKIEREQRVREVRERPIRQPKEQRIRTIRVERQSREGRMPREARATREPRIPRVRRGTI